jgi:RluA family pseudouridine synthase
LPGSQPYLNYRPLKVPAKADGMTVIDFLGNILGHVPRDEWESLCHQHRMLDADRQPVSVDHVVRAGERYLHLQPATSEPDVNVDIRLLYEDEAIIVLNKPAPLPMHPSGRFNRNTLQHILCEVYRPQAPRPGHRLDANTTGLVVFARTKHFAGLLQPQFARGEVEKVYVARVQGHPPEDVFTCEAAISNEAGDVGSREVDETSGLPSRTDFRVIERLADGTSLLEVTPRTGRTNQIRVHLWELGWPICGDQIYLPAKQRGSTQTLSLDSPPLCLHAWRLSFIHPRTKERVTFEAEIPAWFTTNTRTT